MASNFDNHQKATELLVDFCKVESDKPSMAWSQSVDEALGSLYFRLLNLYQKQLWNF